MGSDIGVTIQVFCSSALLTLEPLARKSRHMVTLKRTVRPLYCRRYCHLVQSLIDIGVQDVHNGAVYYPTQHPR